MVKRRSEAIHINVHLELLNKNLISLTFLWSFYIRLSRHYVWDRITLT